MTNGPTIGRALSRAVAALARHGITPAQEEAERLLAHCLKLKRHELFLNSDKTLDADENALFIACLERRLKREPSQYIVGAVEFHGLTLKVTRATLIPRPETELLVDEAIGLYKRPSEGPPIIIDLCTGSGCVAIAIAKVLMDAMVFATDISAEALKVAEENAELNGVRGRITFKQGNLLSPLEGLDLHGMARFILANPPYVSKDDMDGLAPEIKDFEPISALYGGVDGLDFYRRIIPEACKYLKAGGYLLMEMGYGQAEKIKTMFDETPGYRPIEIKKDLAGIERVATAMKAR